MDYDDTDFQNHNLHLAGEANTKFPPVSLPRFDFDERFDSLVETEGFLGIEGNEDSNWIEDFSRGSSGVVFSSAATESCAISRHTNVWSEATSSESVEMLLNSVGQEDQVIVREKDNSIKTSDELGCTMDQLEPGQTNLETILSKEETPTNPSVDDTPGDSSSVCKTDAGQEQVPLKDDSPTLVQEESEDNANLASNTTAVPVEVVDTACHDKIGTETTDSLLDQTVAENNAVLAHVSSAGLDSIGTETTDSVHNQTVTEEASMEENSVVLPSDTGTVEAVDTGGHGKIRTETTYSLLDQTQDEANTESRMEIDCSHGTVQTGVSASGELNNQTTLLPEVFNDENDISDHTAKSDLKDMELSDVTVLERGDQALSALEVAEPDVSGTQCQDLPVSSANTSATVEASLELTGVLPNITSSEHESTFQTETHTEILRVETSESVNVSQMDSMVECTDGDVSNKGDNKEGSARISYLKQSMELAVNANDRDQDAKSSQVLSESFVSESVGYVSRDSASKLVESNSQSDTIPKENPGTMIDIKECEAFPLKPEESQHLSQDGASAVSLTSSVDLHMVTTSSEANEQVNFSVTEKVLSGEPENCQTVSPVEASNSGIHIAQQPSKHTEDTQQSTQFFDGCPTSEGSKDAVDADAAGQVLPQQCEETILEKNLTEVVDVPDPDAKSSQVLSESVVSESVGYVIRDSASKLVESNSQSDTIPIDKSGTMIDGKECEAFPLKPEESQHLSQDGASAVSLTSSVDLHMVTTSSEANEQVNFSVTGKVSSAEPENCQTVPPVEASNSGGPIVQQPRKQTEDTHQSTQFVEGCPASEGPKDAVDADAAGQVLPQQCEGRILEETLTEVVNVPEFQSVLDNDAINENPSASPLAKTAAGGIMTAATPVSHPTDSWNKRMCTHRKHIPVLADIAGGVIEIGVSCASTSSEPFVKSHVAGTENAATNLGSPVISSPARKMTELQLNKTEDQNTLSLMATESPVLNRNPTFSSGLNLTSDPRKAVEIPETTLVSPIVVGSPSKSSLEKTAAKSSKRKSERKANAVNQNSGSSTQITHSTEKQQSLQTPVLNSFGTLSAPTTSLPDMNSTAPSSIFRRPFTDSQQVQLRAQIFVYGGLIQGTAPDEAYMISAFGGADGGRGTWEKAWRACAVRAQRMRVSSPETPLQSRAGKTETPSMSHTSSKASSATKPIIPLSSPLWSLSTPLETLQSRSIQRGSAAAPLPSSSHAHQAASVTNIGHNTAWMSLSLPQPVACFSADQWHVLSGTSGNIFKGTQTLEPASTVVAPAQHSTGTKSRKRKKMPVSVESDPSILNSLQQTEVVVSPLVSISTPVPITAAPGSLTSNAGTLPSVDSISAVPMNLVSTFPGKKMKSSLQSPIFGGNLVSEVKQRSVLPADTIDKLNEAKMHAEDASALATAAVSHSEYAKLMAEEASLPSVSYQGNELHKSNDVLTQGQGTPASVLKGEGAVVSSIPFLSAAREAAKKRVEAATAATKRAENVESIVKAAELASEAVSQAGILVSMGHPPSLNKLVEVGPSNYWRQAQESEKVQPCKVGVLEKETETTSDRGFASPSTAHTELDGSARTADGLGLGLGTESEQIMKKANDECIKEGSHVEVFKEGPKLRTAWYSANVLSLEDGKAYVLFSDLSVEQGTDKLKEWVALKGEGDEAPKIRTARSITALPYEGTRKRRRAAIGDPVWKLGDRVDSWVHDSWLEGVITEKNKNDENTVTVHFPAQGETLTIKAWNLRPSLVWKDGRWIECSTSGESISSSHEGDTPKEKRPRLGAPAPVAEGKDTKMETAVDPDLGKPPQTGVLDLGVSETTFNIGRKEGNPGPLRMKRTGLQTQGAKVIYGVPKPGKTRKFMDVSKHYVSEASNQTRKQKEPAKAVKPIVPQNPGPGSWRLPSKPREKQTTTTTKPKTFKPAPKTKEKPVAAPRIIPRKDSRNTTSLNMESEDAVGQSGENKGPASTSRDPAKGTGEEQITSSSQGQDSSSSTTTGKGKVAPTAGRLPKIEEAKALDDNSSKASDGMEPRRSANIHDDLKDSFHVTQQKSPKSKETVTLEASR
ncbi:hypothetical protein Bca101_091865 [Brassica carinata]